MRVIIYTNHFYPEDFKVNDIAFELQKRGYDITIVSAVPDYPKGKFFEGYGWFKKNREIVNGCKVIRLPIIPRGNGGGKRLILQYLSYFISSSIFTFFHKLTHKYDAVFVHLTSPFFIGLPATKLKKFQHIPMYFWMLDLWPESITAVTGIKNPLIIKPLERQVKYVYNNCDKILIGSKGFEKSISEKGNYKDKFVYFPNWAELNLSSINDIDYKNVEPFCSLKDDDFVILFAGNIGEGQNLSCFLEAALELRNEQNIKFILLGDGRAKNTLEKYAETNGLLDENVFFPGRFPLEAMPYFMEKASVLFVSLKDELIFNLTVPAKVQFYMAQGKPILAMLNGDGADLINEAKCGMAVDANDKGRLIEAILKLKNKTKKELLEFGRNGYDYYINNFNKELRISQLIGIFKQNI